MSLLYQTIMNNQSNHNTHLNKCAFKKVMIAEQEVEDAGIASNFSFQTSSLFQLQTCFSILFVVIMPGPINNSVILRGVLFLSINRLGGKYNQSKKINK